MRGASAHTELAEWLASKPYLQQHSHVVPGADAVQEVEKAVLNAAYCAPQQLIAALLADHAQGLRLLMQMFLPDKATVLHGNLHEQCIARTFRQVASHATATQLQALLVAVMQLVSSSESHLVAGALLMTHIALESVGNNFTFMTDQETQQAMLQALGSDNNSIAETATSILQRFWSSYDHANTPPALPQMLQQASLDMQHGSVAAAQYVHLAVSDEGRALVEPHIGALVATVQQQHHATCSLLALDTLVAIAQENPSAVQEHELPSWLRLWLVCDVPDLQQQDVEAALIPGDMLPGQQQPSSAGPGTPHALQCLMQSFLQAVSCKHQPMLLLAAEAAVAHLTVPARLTLLQPVMAASQHNCLHALQVLQNCTIPATSAAKHLWARLAASLPSGALAELLQNLLRQLASTERQVASRAAALLDALGVQDWCHECALWVDGQLPSELTSLILSQDITQQLLFVQEHSDAPQAVAVASAVLLYSCTASEAEWAPTVISVVEQQVEAMLGGVSSAGAFILNLAGVPGGRRQLLQHEVRLVNCVLQSCQKAQQRQQKQIGSDGIFSLAVLCQLADDHKGDFRWTQQLPVWLQLWLLGESSATPNRLGGPAVALAQTSAQSAASSGQAAAGPAEEGGLLTVQAANATSAAAEAAVASAAVLASASSQLSAMTSVQIPVPVLAGLDDALSHTAADIPVGQAASTAVNHAVEVAPAEIIAAAVNQQQLHALANWPMMMLRLTWTQGFGLATRAVGGLLQVMVGRDDQAACKAARLLKAVLTPHVAEGIAAQYSWPLLAHVVDVKLLLQALQSEHDVITCAAYVLLLTIADVQPSLILLLGSVLEQQVHAAQHGSKAAAARLAMLSRTPEDATLQSRLMGHAALLMATRPAATSKGAAAVVHVLNKWTLHNTGRLAVLQHQQQLLPIVLDVLHQQHQQRESDDNTGTAAVEAAAVFRQLALSPEGRQAICACPSYVGQLMQAAVPGDVPPDTVERRRNSISSRCNLVLLTVRHLVAAADGLVAVLDNLEPAFTAMCQTCFPAVAEQAGQLLSEYIAARPSGAYALCTDWCISSLVDLLQLQQGIVLLHAAKLVCIMSAQSAGKPLLCTRRRFEAILAVLVQNCSDTSSGLADIRVARHLVAAVDNIVTAVCLPVDMRSTGWQQPQALLKASHVHQLAQATKQPALACDLVWVLKKLEFSDQYKLLLAPCRHMLQATAQELAASASTAHQVSAARYFQVQVDTIVLSVDAALVMTQRNAGQAWRSFQESAAHFAQAFAQYRSVRQHCCCMSRPDGLATPCSTPTMVSAKGQPNRTTPSTSGQQRALASAQVTAAVATEHSAVCSSSSRCLKRAHTLEAKPPAGNVRSMPLGGGLQQLASGPVAAWHANRQRLKEEYVRTAAAVEALVKCCTVHSGLQQQLHDALGAPV